jgi:hypothetical protein
MQMLELLCDLWTVKDDWSIGSSDVNSAQATSTSLYATEERESEILASH